jgi:hypothetical protein
MRYQEIRIHSGEELTITPPTCYRFDVWVHVVCCGILWNLKLMCGNTVSHTHLQATVKESQSCCDYGQHKHIQLYSMCVQNRPHTCQKLIQWWQCSMNNLIQQHHKVGLLGCERHVSALVSVKDRQHRRWRKKSFTMCATVATFVTHSPRQLT